MLDRCWKFHLASSLVMACVLVAGASAQSQPTQKPKIKAVAARF